MKRTGLILLISGFWLLVSGFCTYAQDETLTLLTYYPAPYGVYQNLNVTGNIGIGMTNPGAKLTIASTGGTGLEDTDGSAEVHIGTQMATAGTAGEKYRLALQPYGHTGGPFNIVNRDTSNSAFLDVRYGTGGTLFTIKHDGKIGIGTTDPDAKLTVRGDTVIGMFGDTLLHIKRDIHPFPGGPVVGTHDVLYASAGGYVGLGTTHPDSALDVNGDIECDLSSTGNTGYVGYVSSIANGGIYKFVRYSSSKKYKENIRDFHHGLDIIKQLRPVEFNWKSTGDRDFGFIAEEAEEVDPILVVRMNGEAETFKYMQLTAILTNAVKEQQNQIDILKQEINELKARLNAGQ